MGRSGPLLAIKAGAILAAAVGVGRFTYTPILPLMQLQAGVTADLGALLATANYVGYLIGAFAVMFVPALGRSAIALRISGVCVIVSLAAMPVTTLPEVWIALRCLAGVASAIMFVGAASAALNARSRHLVGWAYGGVGAGIALSGLVVLLVSTVGDWRTAWWASAALGAALTTAGWNLIGTDCPTITPTALQNRIHRPHRWFAPLVAAYFLEGVGYIVAGTFLVSTIGTDTPGPLGKAAWIIVGVAAIPSCVLWAWISDRVSHPTLLTIALALQAAGIALAGFNLGLVGAVTAAVLFGGTFMGIVTLTMDAGRFLQIPTAVAILSAIYAIGQALGPTLVAPLLSNGFQTALFTAAGVVAVAAVGTMLLRIRYPQPETVETVVPRLSAERTTA